MTGVALVSFRVWLSRIEEPLFPMGPVALLAHGGRRDRGMIEAAQGVAPLMGSDALSARKTP
jgi:hypothetical protein